VAGRLDTLEEAFNTGQEFIGLRQRQPLPAPQWLPTPAHRRFRRALATLDQIVGETIAGRRAAPERHDDLLAMLLEARDEATGEGMADRQLRDEALTIFFAGHETTATLLGWAFYFLARQPEVEGRLRAELDETLGGRRPEAADLPRLAYMQRVVDETLRHRPPAWIFVRESVDADRLGDYAIPAGATLMLSPYATHHHPAYWDEPERFDPDRFLPERSAGRPEFAYFPFGGGPHLCIGNNLALFESQVILATVLQRYRLRLPPGARVETMPSVTLRQKGGLPMRLEPL
jgi:cytochrome P450